MLFAILLTIAAADVRVIKFAESVPFQMGEVTSRRIVHPGIGAKKTTLNLSVSKPGNEFAQHVHDYSTDTILVLDGEVNLKQGTSLHRFKAGQAAFVPVGQIHGTVTAGGGEATMISFQNPPDLMLYSGARDSKKSGVAPKGDITPGAVKFVNFSARNGPFVRQRATGIHRRLKRGSVFHTSGKGEEVIFVWRGSLKVSHLIAGERDTIFLQDTPALEITAEADSEIIQIEAP